MSKRQTALMMSVGVVLLLLIGLFELTSTSVHTPEHDEPFGFVEKQGRWLLMGVFLAIVFAVLDYRWLKHFWWLAYGFCILLLALTLVPGMSAEVNGEARWLQVGSSFRFQTSETAKIAVVLALASWFAKRPTDINFFWKGFFFPAFLLALPVVMIFVQTDMGTAVCLAGAGGVVLFLAGVRLRYLVAVALLASIGLGVAVMQNENRLKRVQAMIARGEDRETQESRDRNWQQDRAELAFQNGGISGSGLYEGRESRGTLPYAHTDFIFAAIGEEMGLVATLGVVCCYLLIVLGTTKVAATIQDDFGMLLIVGLAASIFVPALLNMMVVTGMVPNSGLPLPLVSYGGTNLVLTLAAFGIMLSVCLRGQREKEDHGVEALQASKLQARL